MTEYVLYDPDGQEYHLADRASLLRFLAHCPDIPIKITVEAPWTLLAKIPHRGGTDRAERPGDVDQSA